MFAELPTVDPVSGEDIGDDKDGTSSDCVLQYKKVQSKSGSEGTDSSSEGEAESIGFVHKVGKRKYCAHVAFADAHVEKINVSNMGDADLRRLTTYLCTGKSFSISGSSVQELR